jgi:hypothetical protein
MTRPSPVPCPVFRENLAAAFSLSLSLVALFFVLFRFGLSFTQLSIE